MNIAWMYLDKRNATINALKDYESMNYIIENARAVIDDTQAIMTGMSSPTIFDMPKGPHNPHAAENKIIKAMDTTDILHERLRRAQEYMEWFDPAWSALTEDEQFVLRRFYMYDASKQANSVCEICEHFNLERSSAYKKKDRALSHLSTLLYGK